MSCQHCGDTGIFRLKYHSGEPDHYAVCVCEASRWYRCDKNAGRHTGYFGWQVWAFRNQIDPELVALVEELLELDEMAAAFPWWQPAAETSVQTDRIADAMRTQPGPRL